MHLKPLAVPAVIAAAALSLSACGATGSSSGGPEFSGAKKDVAQAIDDLQSDAQRHDAGKICDQLIAGATIKRLSAQGIDCADDLKKAIDEASTFDLQVQSVEIHGDKAVAKVKDTAGDQSNVDTFTLVKEGGDWKLLGLGPTGQQQPVR